MELVRYSTCGMMLSLREKANKKAVLLPTYCMRNLPTLLTPTRNRKHCFTLLESYVKAQSIPYRNWIVCNDGDEEYTYTMGQTVINRDTSTDHKQDLPSICLNYLACVERLKKTDKVILCIEDDDYIAPDYFETMMAMSAEVDLFGLSENIYYHVGMRAWKRMANKDHSSLATTGFNRSLLPVFVQCARIANPFIDMVFWAHCGTLGISRRLRRDEGEHVGMKSTWPPGSTYQKGCNGIGLGHKFDRTWHQDEGDEKLVELLGDNAANYQ